MTTYLTSAVYDAWRLINRLLEEAQWPADPGNDDGVAVWFGDPTVDVNTEAEVTASLERAVLLPAIESSQQEWGPVGQLAREELFDCLVVIQSFIPGRSAIETMDRLEALTAVVEDQFRRVFEDGRNGTQQPEVSKYQVAQLSVRMVDPILPPLPDGWFGRAEIRIGCKFRVGTPPVA